MRSQAGEGAGINTLMADAGDAMNAISASGLVTRRTAESFSVLDIAGINYADPYLLAGCGDIDITGHRRPASYYRQIVFGLRAQPYLAVQRPEHHGKTFTGSPVGLE
jgi:hypothetical protein